MFFLGKEENYNNEINNLPAEHKIQKSTRRPNITLFIIVFAYHLWRYIISGAFLNCIFLCFDKSCCCSEINQFDAGIFV
jgi:hypothetical protein